MPVGQGLFGLLRAHLPPRGSSWHFALSPFICVILRSSSPRSRYGVFSHEVRTLRLSSRGWSIVAPWSFPPLEVISPCTRTRTKLLICSFELVVTLSLLSMFSCKTQQFQMHIQRWTCYIISVPSGGLVA
jgi:hypothetical protein